VTTHGRVERSEQRLTLGVAPKELGRLHRAHHTAPPSAACAGEPLAGVCQAR
jgi:hypothetical protein